MGAVSGIYGRFVRGESVGQTLEGDLCVVAVADTVAGGWVGGWWR